MRATDNLDDNLLIQKIGISTMGAYPNRCPSCKEPNNTNLHYCAKCGTMFKASAPKGTKKSPSKKAISKEQKLKIKKLKKKKELIELYKKKKITNDQFAKGMAKLGYSTDIEKALEFKKYIKAQIQAFETMDVSNVNEGEYHFDPNESSAQLPRDEHGNVITDFSITPTPAVQQNVRKETYSQPKMVSSRPPPSTISSGGPMFGESLFGGGGPAKPRAPRKEIPKATLKRDMTQKSHRKHTLRRKSDDLEWDDEEDEEEEMIIDEEVEDQDEEFEIDLDDEDLDGESGWWDDDEWELDWSEEDEEDSEDWDWDEEEDDEWEMWEEEHEHPEGVIVEFEDEDEEEEEDEDDDVFDPRTYYEEEEDDDEEDEEEEEDDDWGRPVARRRKRH